MASVAGLFVQLYAKDNALASRSLRELEAQSRRSDTVYSRFGEMTDMLEHPSAYVRARAMTLLAANVRWDADGRMEGALAQYLTHIADEKPTVARQCIRRLPDIVRCKPQLAQRAVDALCSADTSAYPDSMRALVEGDIDGALRQISRLMHQQGTEEERHGKEDHQPQGSV